MYEYNCKIRRVVDGDTVDVDVDLGWGVWKCNERIRLYGIDTPECRTRDALEKKAGFLAKEFVEKALHVGETYKLSTRDKGKYGRYLGVITIEGTLTINAALVSENLAITYNGEGKYITKPKHEANYEILKEKGLL